MKEFNNLIETEEDPIKIFNNWFEEAKVKEINDPNAMNLATISKDHKPTSRMVLLKSFNEQGFVFYTNLESKKGKSINFNPNVALNFHWKSLFKQIRIEGKAMQISDSEADTYFESRDTESKIGAWSSSQSSELKDREELKKKFENYSEKFKNQNVTRPAFWTGFRVNPNLIEFWKQLSFRLHDRVEYKKIDGSWVKRKLYP